MTDRPQLAGFNASAGSNTDPDLFAGESPVITTWLPLAASVAVERYQVLAKNSSGNLVLHDPGASDGTEIAICIAGEAVASAGSVQNIPVFVGGFFNHEMLVWHEDTNTLVERRAAFDRTPIQIGSIPAVRA